MYPGAEMIQYLFLCLDMFIMYFSYLKMKRKKEIKMSNYYKGTWGLIGNTPLVEIVNIERDLGLRNIRRFYRVCIISGR